MCAGEYVKDDRTDKALDLPSYDLQASKTWRSWTDECEETDKR